MRRASRCLRRVALTKQRDHRAHDGRDRAAVQRVVAEVRRARTWSGRQHVRPQPQRSRHLPYDSPRTCTLHTDLRMPLWPQPEGESVTLAIRSARASSAPAVPSSAIGSSKNGVPATKGVLATWTWP